MQRKKAHIDARIQEANIDKGIIVLLTGDRVVGISIIDHFATYAGKSCHPV
jgi:hypothetical protein